MIKDLRDKRPMDNRPTGKKIYRIKDLQDKIPTYKPKNLGNHTKRLTIKFKRLFSVKIFCSIQKFAYHIEDFSIKRSKRSNS